MTETAKEIFRILELKELSFDKSMIFHSGVDYKTIELKDADFSKIENLSLVKHYDIKYLENIENKTLDSHFVKNFEYPYYKAGNYKIVKTREMGYNSGMNIYGIYDSKHIKLGQIKQFYREDKAHKNVLELRGIFCHFHEKDTENILQVLGLNNQYSKKILHIDYCIDIVDFSVEDIIKAVKNEKNADTIKLVKKKGITEYYCIKTSKTEIKIYNKIKDILENHENEERYKDYIMLNRTITRIEVAFKDTNSWNNRTYGAILKKIEGVFCDMIAKTLIITSGLWASFKKNINVIKEDIVKGVEKIKEVKQVVDYNIKTLKRAIRNLKFLLTEKEQKTIETEIKSCERSSLHYNLKQLNLLIN